FQRRGYREPARVHGDADGTAAPPPETVFNPPAGKPDQQRLFCCSSIHFSERALTALASRSAVSIGGQMRTMTVPARLMKALRGQKSPVLWATGTAGAPVAAASQAPPSW